jgi:hypothetical protein
MIDNKKKERIEEEKRRTILKIMNSKYLSNKSRAKENRNP